MSNDINRVMIIGRLIREPEVRQIPSGATVATFSVANNKTYMSNNEKREDVSYFNCIMWGKGGETFAKYAKKGQQVSLDGRLQQRRWQDKEGKTRSIIEIVVENFQFLSYNKEGNQETSRDSELFPADPNSNTFSNEDIPF
jgi:single-strand DNA-binding protein